MDAMPSRCSLSQLIAYPPGCRPQVLRELNGNGCTRSLAVFQRPGQTKWVNPLFPNVSRKLLRSLPRISRELTAHARIRIRANVDATNVVHAVRIR